MAIPLKDCKQCSHYRGGHCYGFGTAKKVFSTAEAILCGNYTPLGQVQIGPLPSLAGQLVAYQLPESIITTLKIADAAVTLAKLSASSVNDSKVAPGAAIAESKLNLDFSTTALDDMIDLNIIDIASNLGLIMLREEFANKDQSDGYLGLDAGAKVPLSKLNPLTDSEIAVAAAIVESKLSLTFGTQTLNDDIQTRQVSSEKGVANGYCDLDSNIHVPLSRLSNLTNAQIAAAAAILESKLALDFPTHSNSQDHPQSHTLGSHSTKAHSELTGVTTGQHHPQSHTLGSHSTKAHSELTGIGATDHHSERAVPSFPPLLENGASWGAFSSAPIIVMPASDSDCYFKTNFRVPDEYPSGALTLKIMYAKSGTGVYSVEWDITALSQGDDRVAEENNVKNGDTAHDFPSVAANLVSIMTWYLSDADIIGGCSLGVGCQSDALNTQSLYIMEMWIEP